MLGHLILCPEDTTWAMSPETFTTKLRERWPNAEVRPEIMTYIVLDWSVETDEVLLQGTFHRDGLTVGLRGYDGYAIFACWYRSLVPPEVPLIMMERNYNEVYPLTPETTPEDILSGRIVLRPPPDPEVFFSKRTR